MPIHLPASWLLSIFFPTPGLLHDHVAAHFQRVEAPSFSHIGIVQNRPCDRLAVNDLNFTSDTLVTPGTRITHTSGWSRTTQASGNINPTTCVKCGLSFSRAADLNRHSGVHLPERRKYHCVVKNYNYKGSYRKDKLASHVKNRHDHEPRPATISHK